MGLSTLGRVEVPITDHLKNSRPNLEKYKEMQNFP